MAIYDTMMLIEPDVATTAMGMAASMGQFLLTAGAKGKRYGAAARPDPDAPAERRRRRHRGGHRHPGRHAEQVEAGDGRTASPSTPARPVERIDADSDRDRWFTAQEALEYGFIDKVVSRATRGPGAAKLSRSRSRTQPRDRTSDHDELSELRCHWASPTATR